MSKNLGWNALLLAVILAYVGSYGGLRATGVLVRYRTLFWDYVWINGSSDDVKDDIVFGVKTSHIETGFKPLCVAEAACWKWAHRVR